MMTPDGKEMIMRQGFVTAADIPAMAARILTAYRQATGRQLAEGRAWYNAGRRLALRVGRGDLWQGAGMLAALSPATPWKLNVRNALALAAGLPYGTLGMNVSRANLIKAGADFRDVLPAGSKTWNFAHNLAGDLEHVTVDRWAMRVATGRNIEKLSRNQLGLVAEAYKLAAWEAGERPAHMQAITWLVARGTTAWDLP